MSPARRSYNLAPTPATDRADDWRSSAACLDVDPELFFTGGYPSAWGKHPQDAARAKAICADCPVVAECLANAYDIGDWHSISGGLTPSQRRRRAKPQSPAPPQPTKCQNGRHDITKPDALTDKGWCRQCKRDREARYAKRRRRAVA